jgi:4-hydroxybenzoate polyprenyltransferase
VLAALVASLRPHQWVKNLFVFGGLIFAQKLFTPLVWPALAAFVVFCGLSSGIYLINDVVDRDKDRRHPDKRARPVAAGRLPVGVAVGAALLLLAAGLGASLALSGRLALAGLAFVVLLGAYSAGLKHVVIVDVLVVAGGFALRAVAGALAIDVEISGWLLICTALIALFLALGKRRHEVLALGAEARAHRPVLALYSSGLLDQMIAAVTAATVTAYALYTMSPETVAKFDTRWLPATLPFVLYGIFRYLFLLYGRQQGGNPSELFLHDPPLLVNTLLWLGALLVIIYGPRLH